jgi:hypothetical protein
MGFGSGPNNRKGNPFTEAQGKKIETKRRMRTKRKNFAANNPVQRTVGQLRRPPAADVRR